LTEQYQQEETPNNGTDIPNAKVEYADVDGLVRTLEGHAIHTVICTFAISGSSLKTSQMNLITAATRASSIVRFVPTSYSISYQGE
jgi:hypothetical protein